MSREKTEMWFMCNDIGKLFVQSDTTSPVHHGSEILETRNSSNLWMKTGFSCWCAGLKVPNSALLISLTASGNGNQSTSTIFFNQLLFNIKDETFLTPLQGERKDFSSSPVGATN